MRIPCLLVAASLVLAPAFAGNSELEADCVRLAQSLGSGIVPADAEPIETTAQLCRSAYFDNPVLALGGAIGLIVREKYEAASHWISGTGIAQSHQGAVLDYQNWSIARSAGRPAAEYLEAFRHKMRPIESSIVASNAIGYALAKEHRFEEAKSVLEAANSRFGDHPFNLRWLTIVYFRLGEVGRSVGSCPRTWCKSGHRAPR